MSTDQTDTRPATATRAATATAIATLKARWRVVKKAWRRGSLVTTSVIAAINRWQMTVASKRLRPPGVTASFTVASSNALPVLAQELEAAGWTLTSSESSEPGVCRFEAHSRLVQGSPSAVTAHAATQLQLTLPGCSFTQLSVVADDPTLDDFRRWLIVGTPAATADEWVAIRETGEYYFVAGSEDHAWEVFEHALSDVVRDGSWRVVPGNATAVQARSRVRSSTRGIKVSALALAAVVAAVAGGSFIPAWVFGVAADASTRWLLWLALGLVGAGFVVVSLRLKALTRTEGVLKWFDWIALAVLTVLPVLVVVSMLAGFIGSAWTIGICAVTLTFIFVGILFGRPSVLVARHSPSKAAGRAIVSISLVVLVLNVPVTVFMFAAGVPQVLGSVPIGTVVASGAAALALAVIFYLSVRVAARGVRRNLAPTLRSGFAICCAFYAALALGFNVATAYQDGFRLGQSGLYSDSTLGYGIQAICVHDPADGQKGTFWLAGTAGRTTYLIPRSSETETPGSLIQIDASHELDYPGEDRPCPSK
jgi:hypothetical protein